MEKRNTISKSEKLKSRKAIEQMFALRQSFSVPPVRVFYNLTGEEAGIIKAGFGAGKKYFRHAVQRNRAKRLMREAYRTQKHILAGIIQPEEISLHLFFIYTNNELINYSEMQNTISVILHRMEKIVNNRFTRNL